MMRSFFPFRMLLIFWMCSGSISSHAQQFRWAKHLPGVGYEYLEGMKLDARGFVYLTGAFSDSADFDPGPGTHYLKAAGAFGNEDIWFGKYTPDGSLVWVKRLGNAYIDHGNDIAVDDSGNVYVCGYFSNLVDFDPGPASFILNSQGLEDGFVAKYDSLGNFKFAIGYHGGNTEYAQKIETDSLSNFYVTGIFGGTVDFNKRFSTVNLTSKGSADVFFAKYGSNGNLLWVKGLGGKSWDYPLDFVVDDSLGIRISGAFRDTADFDPGAGTLNLISKGGYDMFVGRYSSSGNLLWANGYGGTGDENPNAIDVDGAGNTWVGGKYRDTLMIGSFILPPSPNAQDEMFLARFGPNGNIHWAKHFGATNHDAIHELTVRPSGRVLVGGSFWGTGDFDPGPGVFTLKSSPAHNMFISEFDASGNFQWARSTGDSSGSGHVSAIRCDSNDDFLAAGYFGSSIDLNFGTGAHRLTATFSDMFVASYASCPIIITTPSVTICPGDSFKFGKQTLTTAGSYQEVFMSTFGCDSFPTMQLFIAVLHNDTIPVTICQGQSYPFNNTHVSVAGTYHDTLAGMHGCDSIVRLELSVTAVDTAIVKVTHGLRASDSTAIYQWLNCDSGYAPIPGATSRLFLTGIQGNYALRITDNGCTDTSSCYFVLIMSLPDEAAVPDVRVFPNPANRKLNVHCSNVQNVTAELRNSLGQLVLEEKHAEGDFTLDLRSIDNGSYYLLVRNETFTKTVAVQIVR